MLQQIEVEIREVVYGIEGLRLFRVSKARVDGRQHARATRKLIEHRGGRLDADFGMQEQQRFAVSAFNQLDADVVDNDRGRWIGGHRLYSEVVMPTWPLRGLDVTFIPTAPLSGGCVKPALAAAMPSRYGTGSGA